MNFYRKIFEKNGFAKYHLKHNPLASPIRIYTQPLGNILKQHSQQKLRRYNFTTKNYLFLELYPFLRTHSLIYTHIS